LINKNLQNYRRVILYTSRIIMGVISMFKKHLKHVVISLFLATCSVQAQKFHSVDSINDLIRALNTANSNNENDVIDLGGCTLTIETVSSTNPSTCLPIIEPDNQSGAGRTVTIRNGTIDRDLLAPNLRCRHFEVDVGATLILERLTLKHGLLNPGDSSPDNYGGSIYNQGTLSIKDVTFSNNSAGFGGAIYNDDSLSIGDSTFYDNTASFDGGAIYNSATIDNIFNLTFFNNIALVNGGAVYNLDVINNMTNNTVSVNKAGENGGGLYNNGTIYIFISNIVAVNTAVLGMDIYDPGHGIGIAQNNLIGIGDGNFIIDMSVDPIDENQVGTLDNPIQPRLGPLQDNGGCVFTMSLLLTSPAINAGANPLGLKFDARGRNYVRSRGQTDIGAFEAQLCNNIGDDDDDGWCNDVDSCSHKKDGCGHDECRDHGDCPDPDCCCRKKHDDHDCNCRRGDTCCHRDNDCRENDCSEDDCRDDDCSEDDCRDDDCSEDDCNEDDCRSNTRDCHDNHECNEKHHKCQDADCCCKLLDLDHDGINNKCDNCVSIANPDQEDRDDDGIGDVCDLCPDDETNTCEEIIEEEEEPELIPVPVLPVPPVMPPPELLYPPPPVSPVVEDEPEDTIEVVVRRPRPNQDDESAGKSYERAPTAPTPHVPKSAGCSQMAGNAQASNNMALLFVTILGLVRTMMKRRAR
jgi:predicted outer membrane repeat protein